MNQEAELENLRKAVQALNHWAGRSKSGYYDEAQDDVIHILRQHGAFGSAA